MIRPLNDRIAEAMRRERLGRTAPDWPEWAEEQKGEWHGRADSFIRICRELGVFIAIEKGRQNG